MNRATIFAIAQLWCLNMCNHKKTHTWVVLNTLKFLLKLFPVIIFLECECYRLTGSRPVNFSQVKSNHWQS